MVTTKTKLIIIIILVAIFTLTVSTMYCSYITADHGPIMGDSIKEMIDGFYKINSINQIIITLASFSILFIAITVIFVIIKNIQSKKNISKKLNKSKKYN
jgi:hypothetical protein